jgi:hypothetical protein
VSVNETTEQNTTVSIDYDGFRGIGNDDSSFNEDGTEWQEFPPIEDANIGNRSFRGNRNLVGDYDCLNNQEL